MSGELLSGAAFRAAGDRAVTGGAQAVDPLSDLLRVVRLNGAYFYAVETWAPWSIETVPARDLSPNVLPAAEHLISYHIVLEGRCFASLLDGDPVELLAGDVIVFPHADAHLMSSSGKALNSNVMRSAPDRYPFTVLLGDGGEETASLVCGFLGCDRRPFNPLIAALPRQLHMKAVANPGIASFIRELAEDRRAGRSGARSVLTRMAEMMFIEVVRRYLEELEPGQGGWLAGLRDEVVGRALTFLHARPGHHWSLAELARETATSRSALTRRFAEVLGQPPMHYLAQWRMQIAANLLADVSMTNATIAASVGYDSEAAFSRAFKKATGASPGAWRAARRAGRN